MDENLYLAHHGIKGQKWGVRRYQNEDGSLTAKGREKYGKQSARKYYKINRLQRAQETTGSFRRYRHLQKKIRKTSTREDRKEALLSETDINKGRAHIAKSRVTRRKIRAIGSAAATGIGVAFCGSNPALGLSVMAISGAVGGEAVYKLPYYSREKRMYKKSLEIKGE